MKKIPELNLIILYVILAVLPVILFFNLPETIKFLFIGCCYLAMLVIFLLMRSKARKWQTSQDALYIASIVILELAAVGTLFWISCIVSTLSDNILLLVICSAMYLSMGSYWGVRLYLYAKKTDPKIIEMEEAKAAKEDRFRKDFMQISSTANTCLELAKDAADKMPSIQKSFTELTNRVASIEKNYTLMLQQHQSKEKELLDTLAMHIDKSMNKLEKFKTDAIKQIKNESGLAKVETEEIISSMSKSLDDITDAIEKSFEPFLKSIASLSLIDEKTSESIDRMADAADTFVKISEPQARLAREAADLIEESVANIRNISARSLSILELELKNAINDALKKLL